jgi:hypothetical protein
LENFQNSQYLYNLEKIDVWCQDNNFPYDKNQDKWDILEALTDYLKKPENIALLSKFWKDGIGSFAFVREEIIQKQNFSQYNCSLLPLTVRLLLHCSLLLLP